MSRLSRHAWLSGIVCLLAGGCTADETALQLRFAVNPLLNTEQQVVAALDSLEIVLDASGGFGGPSRLGQSIGPFLAVDPDRDGTLELSVTRAVRGRSSLPQFRLEPGSNLERSFQILAYGRQGQQIAAVGGLSWAQFAPGESLDLLIPFNLRPSFRPPRVLLTLPHDGQSGVPVAIGQVFLEFSKQLATSSTPGQLRVLYQGSAGDQNVPGTWSFGSSSVVDLGLQEPRTTATLQIQTSCSLSPGTYRIEAGTGIRDAAGVGLDQDAARAGADAFQGRFTIPGTAQAQPCGQSVACTRPEDCTKGKEASSYTCDTVSGKCVIVLTDCAALSCPKGYVCRPATTSSSAQCVQDCRTLGSCAGVSDYCDDVTGLCQRCDAGSTSPKCGNVTESVKCDFGSSMLTHSCSSAKGSCKGVGTCVVTVTGKQGEKLTWSSTCKGTATTVIDGVAEYAKFDCSTPPPPPPTLTEKVQCTFANTSSSQQCYASTGPSCSGVGSCVVTVTGYKGDTLTWKSTCGGYAATTIDGIDETALFKCYP